MSEVFVVCNDYQGVHFFASSRENAQRYIDSKIREATSPNSCWSKENWHIRIQLIDAKAEFFGYTPED